LCLIRQINPTLPLLNDFPISPYFSTKSSWLTSSLSINSNLLFFQPISTASVFLLKQTSVR
jgi:hypothetical protein